MAVSEELLLHCNISGDNEFISIKIENELISFCSSNTDASNFWFDINFDDWEIIKSKLDAKIHSYRNECQRQNP